MSETNGNKLSNWRLFRHIMEHPALKMEERWLAVAIMYHRNEETCRCDPTQRCLSRETGLPQQQISRIVKRLKKKEILETVRLPNHVEPLKSGMQYYFRFDMVKCCEVGSSQKFSGDKESLECVKIKLRLA